MSKTLKQIYDANPVTTILPTDLLYISQSPYAAGNDAAISGASMNNLYAKQAQVQKSAFNFAALGGSSNAFTVTLTPAVTSLTDGMIVTFYSGSKSNTIEAPTLSVNGLTPVTIVCWSGGLAPNDITTATEYLCIYNLADNVFQLVNPSISTANTFEVQANGYNYALDTGVANAYIANILPAQISSILSGFEVIMSAIHANTGASTLTVNGITHPILLSNGAALSGGEIILNGIYQFIYSDALSGFILINSAISSLGVSGISIVGTAYTPFLYSTFNSSLIAPNGTATNGLAGLSVMSSTNYEPNITTLNLGSLISIDNISIQYDNLTTFTAGSLITISGGVFIGSNVMTSLSFPALQSILGSITGLPATLTSLSFPVLVAMPSANITLNSLTSLSFPLLKVMNGSFGMTASSITSFSAPNLYSIAAATTATFASLTTLTLTSLHTATGNFAPVLASLVALSLPALVTCGASFAPNMASGTSITANALTTIGTALTPVGTLIATLSMSSLVNIGTTFSPTLAALTTLTLTNLTTITGAFGLTAATLTTLSLPALVTMGSTWSTTMALVTTATFTNLATVTGAVTASFAALATLNFPAIITFGGAVTFTAANMVTFSLGSTLKTVGGNFTLTGAKLNQASVDGILVSLAALDGTGGTTAYSSKTINLSGGTSSAPSATGLAAKATLVARSCTVTTN